MLGFVRGRDSHLSKSVDFVILSLKKMGIDISWLYIIALIIIPTAFNFIASYSPLATGRRNSVLSIFKSIEFMVINTDKLIAEF